MRHSGICLVAILCALATDVVGAGSSINSVYKWAWSAGVGWVSCRADVTNGMAIHKDYCEGYLYGPTAGWIHLGNGAPTNGFQYTNAGTNDYGVNHDGNGSLSGYAWSATCGWIAFDTNGLPRVNVKNGILSGYAWSSSLGWLSFSNLQVHTRTDWITGVYPVYTITVTAPEGGTITPAGTVLIPYGCSTNFTITTNQYYDLADLQIDTVSVGATNRYSFALVTTNHTLAATFAARVATNGVPESWLATYFPTATNFVQMAVSDDDHDGLTAWQEYVAGLDPTERHSTWAMLSSTQAPSGLTLVWPAAAGREYSISWTTNLAIPMMVIASNLTGNSYTDSEHRSIDGNFYRIGVQLAD